MFIQIFIKRIFNDPVEIIKFCMEIITIYVIIRFRHKVKKPAIELPDSVVAKLINDFEPEDLVETQPKDLAVDIEYSKDFLNLASYDCFEIGDLFKDESKEIINEYGIGTCGPPTFFGTLDVHLALQEKISEILETEDSLLYSNSYTCIHSVISCFSTKSDTIFYFKYANEAIIRGVTLSKSKCYEFDNFDVLINLLKLYFDPKSRNFVIVEGLSKNEGIILDLPKIIKLKKMFNFKIILDESLSIPLLHKRGVCGYFNIQSKSIDIIIGSFSYGFSSSGGFFCGDKSLANYQRLASSSYVFSASLPGVLANFNRLALDKDFDYKILRKKVRVFHKHFISLKYTIISDIKSPIILIRAKNNTCKKNMLHSLLKIVNDLHNKKIYVGINNNPFPTLRVLLKISLNNVKNITEDILNSCEKF
ncbi:hypothetical protein NCER_100379 [Vairimorpha ceranae BRL01]|uniref:serine C-palmitoyltransferase n=1 Tax=Vairimorpha ceranae (strain BRL01) TaxID=578460 RepID=C4V7F0_VAIC1|nr:hypothetical protein NCER_100379 [Vairimorpha ceranae BRL01]